MTDAARARSNANLKPFKPGQSGNPKGRSPGIARRVREMATPDGRPLDILIAEEMLRIATNVAEPTSDRRQALAWLADRGWGTAANFAPIAEEDPLGLADAQDRLVERLAPVARLAERRTEG